MVVEEELEERVTLSSVRWMVTVVRFACDRQYIHDYNIFRTNIIQGRCNNYQTPLELLLPKRKPRK